MRYLPLLVAGCVLAALAADQPSTDRQKWTFDDDQAGQLPAGWSSAKTGEGPGSIWQVVEDDTAPSGGRALAQVSAEGPSPLFNLAVADEPQWTDLDLSVQLKAVAGTIDQGGGPVWRYQDADNYYIARVNPLEKNFRVYKVVDGKRTQLATAEVDAAAGEWHTIRIVQAGASIRCLLDGAEFLTARDDTFQQPGRVGLWTKADAVTHFDDLTVRPPGDEAALLLEKIPADEYPHLHNLIQVAEQIFSGSEPHDRGAFAELARLGVKTIVSVDGARPQVELAREHGMNYVHIPIGYDGIPDEARRTLFRLAEEGQGPFYFHCHHGKHRGPAAAAAFCTASGIVQGQQALKLLEVAGTGKEYRGLWADVEALRPLAPGEELPELVEAAEVESFAAAMAELDRNFDRLKLCQEHQWSVPPDHPDLVPEQEARILRQGLAAAVQNFEEGHPQELRAWLAEAEGIAGELHAALRENDHAAASRRMDRLDKSCQQCHAKYRNLPQ